MVPPVPFRTAVIDTANALLSAYWQRWMNALVQFINTTPSVLGTPVDLSSQAGSIASTALPLPVLSKGLYRVSFYARISQPATNASSLAVDLSWTDGAVAQSASLCLLTNNLTTTLAQGSLLVQVDQGTTLNYTALYSSAGVTPMQYRLMFTVEALPT